MANTTTPAGKSPLANGGKPGAAAPKIGGTTTTTTPAAGSGGLAGFNFDLSGGIAAKKTTAKAPIAQAYFNGKVVPTSDAIDAWAGLPTQTRLSITNFVESQGKPPAYAKTYWGMLVRESQAQLANGVKLDPIQAFINDSRNPAASVVQQITAKNKSNQLNDSNAYNLAYKVLANVLGRVPTAEDMAKTGLVEDPTTGKPVIDPTTGQPATAARAIQILTSTNPDFSTQSSYTIDNSTGLVKEETATAATDPESYLTQQITKANAAAIASGDTTANASVQDQYSALAKSFGQSAFVPGTQNLSPQAMVDIAALQGGTKTLDDIRNNFASQSIGKVAGNLAPALQTGTTTLADAASGAMNYISSTLGIDPTAVSVNDPMVQKYLQGDGTNVMNQQQLQSMVRSDPRWQYTQDAHATMSNLASSILTRFGINA